MEIRVDITDRADKIGVITITWVLTDDMAARIGLLSSKAFQEAIQNRLAERHGKVAYASILSATSGSPGKPNADMEKVLDDAVEVMEAIAEQATNTSRRS